MKLRSKYLLPIPVAGKLVGLTRTPAYQAVRRGDLPTITINGPLYVPVAALEQMLGVAIDLDALEGGDGDAA